MESPLHVAASSSPASVPARPPDPCTLVLFGATGDLAHRKIVPALFELARNAELPRPSAWSATSTSVGRGRGLPRPAPRVDRALRSGRPQTDRLDQLRFRDRDRGGRLHEAGVRRRCGAAIEAAETRRATAGNRLFYFAVPPALVSPILGGPARRGLVHPPGGAPWSRVVIEKPFGRDLASARELNRLVGRVLDEGQIFRIDHYLGKETVQNILVFRFGNAIFEPLWNRKYIDHVQITVGRGDRRRAARRVLRRRPASCATWCRTTCSSCSRWWRWSRRRPSAPTTCATRR